MKIIFIVNRNRAKYFIIQRALRVVCRLFFGAKVQFLPLKEICIQNCGAIWCLDSGGSELFDKRKFDGISNLH